MVQTEGRIHEMTDKELLEYRDYHDEEGYYNDEVIRERYYERFDIEYYRESELEREIDCMETFCSYDLPELRAWECAIANNFNISKSAKEDFLKRIEKLIKGDENE